MHWIYLVIVASRDQFTVGDAVLTRLFQLSSDCNESFNSARRIAESPFPFVFAQIAFMVVHIWAILTPLILAAFFHNSFIYSPLVTMFSTWALFAVNEAAAQIENPFEDAANDLPLVYYSIAFNDNISAVEYMQRPNFLRDAHYNTAHKGAPKGLPLAQCRLSRRFIWEDNSDSTHGMGEHRTSEDDGIWDGDQHLDEDDATPNKTNLDGGEPEVCAQ
jgi:hypothetical protein